MTGIAGRISFPPGSFTLAKYGYTIPMSSLEMTIDSSRQAALNARESLLAWTDEVDRSSLSDLRMVVSELVALSVVNGASQPIDLQLELDDGEARGSVVDAGHVARAFQGAGTGETDSWALQIVDALVDEWGVSPNSEGVWFRMPVERLNEI